MRFRLARKEDLFPLLDMYKQIRDEMEKRGIMIWDDYYPFQLLENDISNEQLYLLEQGDEFLAVLALTRCNPGENAVKWTDPNCKSVYIERFGTNVKYWRSGIGCAMLQRAMAEAKRQGFNYLRLFSEAQNTPAMNLYKKVGFFQVPGEFHDEIEENVYLLEYGYEVDLSADTIDICKPH